MAQKTKLYCEKCAKKTAHETRLVEGQENSVCIRCENPPEKNRMLDPWYIDPRERYSLRPDRAFEEDRIRIGRPF
jgi:hypothetical protein